MKVNKRLSHHVQFLVSYAYQKDYSTGAGGSPLDNMNYNSSYGQDLAHQNLNVSGTINAALGLLAEHQFLDNQPHPGCRRGIRPGSARHCSFRQYRKRFPESRLVDWRAGMQQSAACSRSAELQREYAGKPSAQGTGAPNPGPVVLPPDYQFGDPIFSQDFRLTKTFTYKEKYRLSILGEVFNAFNISNLTYPSFTLDSLAAGCSLGQRRFQQLRRDPCSDLPFGQATGRIGQTFGQGGARAFQVGARFQF